MARKNFTKQYIANVTSQLSNIRNTVGVSKVDSLVKAMTYVIENEAEAISVSGKTPFTRKKTLAKIGEVRRALIVEASSYKATYDDEECSYYGVFSKVLEELEA